MVSSNLTTPMCEWSKMSTFTWDRCIIQRLCVRIFNSTDHYSIQQTWMCLISMYASQLFLTWLIYNVHEKECYLCFFCNFLCEVCYFIMCEYDEYMKFMGSLIVSVLCTMCVCVFRHLWIHRWVYVTTYDNVFLCEVCFLDMCKYIYYMKYMGSMRNKWMKWWMIYI